MPNILMTGEAVGRFLGRGQMVDGSDKFAVAIETIFHGHTPIQLGDLDGFVEIASGESHTVIPAVDSFDNVLGGKGVGGVAIVAGGDIFVAPMSPRIILVVHDVAVDTGKRVVGEVGATFGIDKGKAAQPSDAAEKANGKNPEP